MALLHISDFHFKDAGHPVLERAAAVVAGLQSLMQPVASVFVVVTGDVAFSGAPAEYDLADAFFRDILEQFEKALPGTDVKIVFTPGNHDCDLRRPPDIRDYNLLRPKLLTLDANGTIVINCAKVQDAYFEFTKAFGQTHDSGLSKLAHRVEFRAGGTHRIAFTSYNSSWLVRTPRWPANYAFPKRPSAPPSVQRTSR